MQTIKDLNKHLEESSNILVLALMYYKDLKYLSKPIEPQEQIIVFKYLAFQRIKYSAWVLTVLELCKLFINRETEKYNFHKLLTFLLDSYDRTKWKSAFEKDKILKLKSKLENENQTTIRKLEKLRDKFYAHTDKNIAQLVSRLSIDFIEIDILINLAIEIFNEIEINYFDRQTVFETPGPDRFNHILINLAKFQEYRDKEIQAKWNK